MHVIVAAQAERACAEILRLARRTRRVADAPAGRCARSSVPCWLKWRVSMRPKGWVPCDANAARAAARDQAVGWLEALEGATGESTVRFRYLVAMVAARAGVLDEVGRAARGGRQVVTL